MEATHLQSENIGSQGLQSQILHSRDKKERTYEQKISGMRKNVAVMCWYTSNGRSIPRLIKYQDDDGIIQIIEHIRVLKSDRKSYTGILSHRYDCQALIQGFQVRFTLMYHPHNETWVMIFNE